MRIRIAVPERHVDADILDAALEASTRVAEAQIQADEVPLATESIRRGRVKWQPERFSDGEHFDNPQTISSRGWGDCDDLAPWLAAELRATGKDPEAKAVAMRSGPKRWHAVVQSHGRILDPSRAAGMGKPKHIQGAVNGLMADEGQIGVATLLHKGLWRGRCDLPWEDGHLSGHAEAYDPLNAMLGAIEAAQFCGLESGVVGAQDVQLAESLAAAMCGEDPHALAEMFAARGMDDEALEQIGSLWGSLKHLSSHLAHAASAVTKPLSAAVDVVTHSPIYTLAKPFIHAALPGLDLAQQIAQQIHNVPGMPHVITSPTAVVMRV